MGGCGAAGGIGGGGGEGGARGEDGGCCGWRLSMQSKPIACTPLFASASNSARLDAMYSAAPPALWQTLRLVRSSHAFDCMQ